MKKTRYIVLHFLSALTIILSGCGNDVHSSEGSNRTVSDNDLITDITESEQINDSSSTAETSVIETVAPESTTTTTVPSQPDSSIAESTSTAEDPLDSKPEIDEAAVSSVKAQLADNDIIIRKDTVRDYFPFPTKKCVLYVTSCGDYYASYYERENENADSFWMNDITDTPQSIEEVEGAEYLGTLADEELSELINFSLSVDSNAECYEKLRGEDEDAPAVYRPSYDIYTFMIWDDNHERKIYTAFVFNNLTYYLDSGDECAYAAVTLLNHGDIEKKYLRYYYDHLEL